MKRLHVSNIPIPRKAATSFPEEPSAKNIVVDLDFSNLSTDYTISSLRTESETLRAELAAGKSTSSLKISQLTHALESKSKSCSSLSEQIKKLEDELTDLKSSSSSKLAEVESENSNLKSTIVFLREKFDTTTESLNKENKSLHNEIDSCKLEHDNTKKLLEECRKYKADLIKQNEDLRQKSKDMNHLISENRSLQQMQDATDDSVILNNSFLSHVSQIKDLEAKLKNCKAKCNFWMSKCENSTLLSEQLLDSKQTISELNQQIATLNSMNLQNAEKLHSLKSWEDLSSFDASLTSSKACLSVITSLRNQIQEISLKLSNTQEPLPVKEDSAVTVTNVELKQLRSSKSTYEERIRKLNVVLNLNVKEITSLNELLATYRTDFANKINQCNLERIEHLENSIAEMKEELTAELQKPLEPPELVTAIDELKSIVAKLERENDLLKTNSLKEATKPQFKCLSLSSNPLKSQHDEYIAESLKLRTENEHLKRKVLKLQKKIECLELDLTQAGNTTAAINIQNTQEYQELETAFKDEKNKRAMVHKVYQRDLKQFYEAVKQLFGYSVERIDDDNYKIRCKHFPKKDDYLQFSRQDQVWKMMTSEFALRNKEFIEQYCQYSWPVCLSVFTITMFQSRTGEKVL